MCCLVVFSVAHYAFPASAANTIVVHPSDSIQGAINSASEGDTVFIKNGTYTQSLIIVNKTITLLGESQEGTIIDGERTDEAPVIFNVIADNVRIVNLTIQNATAGFGSLGIGIAHVLGVEVAECTITNAGTGIQLRDSNSCTIVGNKIVHNEALGIRLDANSTNNLIVDNLVTDNPTGIQSEIDSGQNEIYHNNFIGNSLHVAGFGSGNKRWDNGYPSGGNYWSGYSAEDVLNGAGQNLTGSDGIADKPYPNSTTAYDNYPLMGPIHKFWAGRWGVSHYVWIACNSTSEVLEFKFDNASIPYLQFNTTGMWPFTYWCRVTVSKQLMWVDNPSEWQTLVNLADATPLVDEDASNTYFYLNLPYASMLETSKNIQINGTHTVPEMMPSFLLVALILLAAQVGALNRRMRRHSHAEIL